MSGEATQATPPPEDVRQETVSFETPRPQSSPTPRPAEAKDKKNGRAETKPFAVVRDAADASKPGDKAEKDEPSKVAVAARELADDARDVAGVALEASGKAATAALEVSSRAASSALESTSRVANAAAEGVSSRLESARAKIDEGLASEREEWKDVQAGATFPPIGAVDPLADLATRIDREADYWRELAIRTLKPGPARNIGLGTAGLSVVAALVLGIVGAFGALFGIASAGVDLLETAGALAALFVPAGIVSVLLERTRRDVAEGALRRAEAAERRLERVAAILALRKTDPQRHAEALSRLERDATR